MRHALDEDIGKQADEDGKGGEGSEGNEKEEEGVARAALAPVEAVGVIAALIVYFVDSTLYENLLTNLLGRLALANVFTDVTSNSIVDLSGVALYLSIIAVFVFLTVQAIQKRRWS